MCFPGLGPGLWDLLPGFTKPGPARPDECLGIGMISRPCVVTKQAMLMFQQCSI